jgi:hypothetical protein
MSDVLFIKRIVAGPGEGIAFQAGHTVRNGKVQKEPFAAPCEGDACDLPRPAHVPDGMYFMVRRQPRRVRRQPLMGPRSTRLHPRSRRPLQGLVLRLLGDPLGIY